MSHFKSFTAKELLKLLQKENAKTLLEQFKFYKKAHKKDRTYQIWQEGYQPKLIATDKIMINKIKYIHENPVKRGYVDKAIHWRYSSARDYDGIDGLIEVERFWQLWLMVCILSEDGWERGKGFIKWIQYQYC